MTSLHSYVAALEDALQDLLECFEPTTPASFEGYDEEGCVTFVRVGEEVQEVIDAAEHLLLDGLEESGDEQ